MNDTIKTSISVLLSLKNSPTSELFRKEVVIVCKTSTVFEGHAHLWLVASAGPIKPQHRHFL